LGLTRPRIAHAIFAGYQAGLACGGQPFVLEERHAPLAGAVRERLKDPAAFWKKLAVLPDYDGPKPKTALRLLMRLLPHGVESLRVVHRVAGLGSLGRLRFTALAQLDGGCVAREVKQLAPPASNWARRQAAPSIRYNEILRRAVRCADPYLRQTGRWVGRRLSPSNSRVEIDELPQEQDVERLLYAMGFETANVHLGSVARKQLVKAFDALPPVEFTKAVRALEAGVRRDWKEWRERVA
jgi:hypothetical protein